MVDAGWKEEKECIVQQYLTQMRRLRSLPPAFLIDNQLTVAKRPHERKARGWRPSFAALEYHYVAYDLSAFQWRALNLCLSEFTSRYTWQATRLFQDSVPRRPTRDNRIRILEGSDVCKMATTGSQEIAAKRHYRQLPFVSARRARRPPARTLACI
jgi:hypothetical protein